MHERDGGGGRAGGLNLQRNDGRQAELKATQLWPELRLTPSGGTEDRQGIDGYFNGQAVQIKYDATIAKTGNIYHELWEKSVNNPDQEWRHSPGLVDLYIFLTDRFAVMATVNSLALAERDRRLTQISPTSMGFLIPIAELGYHESRWW